MNIAKSLSASRGTSNLLSRIGTIFNRFGMTSGKFEALLERYSALTMEAKCTATLPITAVILKRHPDLIRKFDQKGLKFDVHGYIHIDYQQLSAKEQIEDYKKAIDTFSVCGVPFTGFRAPYLRFNTDTDYALSSLQFPYDSSRSIYWNVINKTDYPKEAWYEYIKELIFYQSNNSLDCLSLPEFSKDQNLIEIPVSLPDDESMIERLGITEPAAITQIWSEILKETYIRGELFTVQLHPERIMICGDALRTVIQNARRHQPAIWLASLQEIASWWKEKEAFSCEIQPGENGLHHIKTQCSNRATLMVRYCSVSCETSDWMNDYRVITARDFTLESSRKPVIGVGLNSSPEAIRFLRSEGYQVEASNQPEKYAYYLGNLNKFQPTDRRRLAEEIEYSGAPLIRYWRWPYQSRSALTITGDIDSITLFDFALRILEARRQSKRQKYQVEVASVGATI